MFRTNDPFWSRQAAREGLLGQDTGHGEAKALETRNRVAAMVEQASVSGSGTILRR